MWELYKTQPSFVLGFHGCDEEVGRAVIGIPSMVHVQVAVRTLSCIKGYFLPIRAA